VSKVALAAGLDILHIELRHYGIIRGLQLLHRRLEVLQRPLGRVLIWPWVEVCGFWIIAGLGVVGGLWWDVARGMSFMLTERSGSCWSIAGRKGSAGIVDGGGAVETGKALLGLGVSIGCGDSSCNGGACGSISAASMSRENGMRGEVITAWESLGDSLMGARDASERCQIGGGW
jgi:hypothetical protein